MTGVGPWHDRAMRIPLSLPHELRRLRTEAGLTQAALERAADLSRRRLWALESGARAPAEHELRALCRALGISFETLAEATRWEQPAWGRPDALEPALRQAFRSAEPFRWESEVPFAGCLGGAFLDFPEIARALETRIDLRGDLRAVERFCRDLPCGAKGEALFDMHLLARQWSPIVISPLELGFADPRVRDYRSREERPYVGSRPMCGLGLVGEDFAAAVLPLVPVDAERPALLDFLLVVRCGTHVARGDLEVDDPGHDPEKDEKRRLRLGLDTLRIAEADLLDLHLPLMRRMKEWCLACGRTRQRRFADAQRPLPQEGQNRNPSASQPPQPMQAEPLVCDLPQPGQKPMSKPTREPHVTQRGRETKTVSSRLPVDACPKDSTTEPRVRITSPTTATQRPKPT